MRPYAVSTKLAGSNSMTVGTSSMRSALVVRPSGATVMCVSPAFSPEVIRTPELHRPGVGTDLRGGAPQHEAERHEQVGGAGLQRVRAAAALADVPAVHGVVDELEDRVEEGRQRAHVLVRDLETAPVLLGERLLDAQHLVERDAQPLDRRVALERPELLGALVHVGRHVDERHQRRRCPAAAGGVEADEVGLGRVDQVPEHVSHLPVPRARRGGPGLRVVRQLEHARRLAAYSLEQVVLALGAHEVPRAHVVLPAVEAQLVVVTTTLLSRPGSVNGSVPRLAS